MNVINILEIIGNISQILLYMLFFISLILYFYVISYLKQHGVKIKFKAFSATLLLSEFKKIAEEKRDRRIHVYYYFKYMVISLILVFIVGMVAVITHDLVSKHLG